MANLESQQTSDGAHPVGRAISNNFGVFDE